MSAAKYNISPPTTQQIASLARLDDTSNSGILQNSNLVTHNSNVDKINGNPVHMDSTDEPSSNDTITMLNLLRDDVIQSILLSVVKKVKRLRGYASAAPTDTIAAEINAQGMVSEEHITDTHKRQQKQQQAVGTETFLSFEHALLQYSGATGSGQAQLNAASRAPNVDVSGLQQIRSINSMAWRKCENTYRSWAAKYSQYLAERPQTVVPDHEMARVCQTLREKLSSSPYQPVKDEYLQLLSGWSGMKDNRIPLSIKRPLEELCHYELDSHAHMGGRISACVRTAQLTASSLYADSTTLRLVHAFEPMVLEFVKLAEIRLVWHHLVRCINATKGLNNSGQYKSPHSISNEVLDSLLPNKFWQQFVASRGQSSTGTDIELVHPPLFHIIRQHLESYYKGTRSAEQLSSTAHVSTSQALRRLFDAFDAVEQQHVTRLDQFIREQKRRAGQSAGGDSSKTSSSGQHKGISEPPRNPQFVVAAVERALKEAGMNVTSAVLLYSVEPPKTLKSNDRPVDRITVEDIIEYTREHSTLIPFSRISLRNRTRDNISQ